MKKLFLILPILLCILLFGCGENNKDITKGENVMYQQITQPEAKSIMDSGDDFIILDVREQDEFDAGHIPGAILIPYTEIEDKADKMLPDKDKQILVYCRSGRRSKIASESLAKLGYTNVKEFGGIIDWEGELEK